MLVLVAWAVSAHGWAADELASVSLVEAVQSGLVEVDVQGRGACSGDAVRVEVRRKVTRTVRLVVEPGTVMESSDGKVQGMVCHGVKYQLEGSQYRRVDAIVLNDDRTQTFVLEAFCRDFSKPMPKTNNSFQLGAVDRQATAVIVKGRSNGVATKAIQIAVWTQRGVSQEEIGRRFRATDSEYTAANKLLAAVNAAEQGDVGTESRIVQSLRTAVKVDLGPLVDGIQERRNALPFRKGDTVVVTSGSARIRARQRTVGTAKKGDQFEVLAVLQALGAQVEFSPGEGEPSQRGWISLDDLQLADGAERGAGRPLLRELGALVSELDLEIVTMSDVAY